MDNLLWHMKKVYGVKDYDWMKFRITKENPLTYHHIKKDADGGKKDVYNGALLTELAQSYLHQIEKDAPEIYDELNNIFLKINRSKKEITKKERDIIERLLVQYETQCNALLRSRIKFERINASAIKGLSGKRELFSPLNMRMIMQQGINPKKFGQKQRIVKRKTKKARKK